MNAPPAGQQFGAIAATFDQTRPPLSDEAVAWMTAEVSGILLDLGAGTGLFTRRLLPPVGSLVHAVEPDLQMLTLLRRNLTTSAVVAIHKASAEAIPLADGSVDAVFAVGSWHWFDHEMVAQEAARILDDGGRLAAMWNLHDDAVEWIDRLNQIVGRHHAPGHEPGVFHLPAPAPFAPPEQTIIRWTWSTTDDNFVTSLDTYSHMLVREPAERADILTQARNHLTRTPGLIHNGRIEVPMRTVCYRTRRLPRT